MSLIGEVAFDANGLVPAIVQQYDTGEVLMMAWMNEQSLADTVERGETVFYSRSRGELWHKGATSGNTQRVVDVRIDCDSDVLLILVDQLGDGVACHTGQRSCFYRRYFDDEHADTTALQTPPAPALAGTQATSSPSSFGA